MSYSRLAHPYPETPQDKVRSSMTCILVELRMAAHRVWKEGWQARITGMTVIRGFSGSSASEQLASARAEFTGILTDLNGSADKKRRNFYVQLLGAFMLRLQYLARPETPDQQKELAALHKEVHEA